MKHAMILLFAIPAISFLVIAIYQVIDETFKKKFTLERRAGRSAEQGSAPTYKRRYSDSVPPGTLRSADKATSVAATEVSVAQIHGA